MGSDTAISEKLQSAITALAELYQPIFGHPDVPGAPSRICDDRLAKISIIHDALSSHLDRTLRVLDLGCAQGYLSLSLASRGAAVTGIDLDANNIAVCNALHAEHPELKVNFQNEDIEEFIGNLRAGDFDLVLGLSVFHHLIHVRGINLVRALISKLADTCHASIFEFALRAEPVYWASSQPENVFDLLEPFMFTHEIANFPTHLSTIERPLIYASNGLWALGDRAGRIERRLAKAYADNPLDYNGTRRYFVGDGRLIKIWSLRDPFWRPGNLKELSHEAAFLTAPPADFNVPRLDVHGLSEHEIWIVREAKAGQLLRDMIREGQPFSPPAVVADVLDQLDALEKAGRFHDDLRTWNVLVQPDGYARLIDYGAIVDTPTDLVWPHNAYLSVITFIRTVMLRQLEPPMAERIPWPQFSQLPPPFDGVIHQWLGLTATERTFNRLRELWQTAFSAPDQNAQNIDSGFAELLDLLAQRYDQRQTELGAIICKLESEVKRLQNQPPISSIT